ncbi:MAG: amidohydrolase family protein [Lentisphaeria bacterium]|nr:amidohydrolase family protein [Lentisphaeria bacterium]
MLIDIHGHCVRAREIPYCTGGKPLVWPELLLAMHREAGIDRGVLLPIIGPENASVIQSNEEVLEIVAASDGHFIPFCNLDARMLFNHPNADFGFLLEHYKAKGCRGVGEVTTNLSFTDPRVLNLLAHVERSGLPLTFHIATREGHTYGLVDDFGLPRLETVLRSFPELRLLGHSQAFWSHISSDVTPETWGGYPRGAVQPGRVVELMRRYPNLHGDLSAGSGFIAVSRDPGFGYEFLDEFQDRLLFGTDVCMEQNRSTVLVNLRDFLAVGLSERRLSAVVYDKITHLNAMRLLELTCEN